MVFLAVGSLAVVSQAATASPPLPDTTSWSFDYHQNDSGMGDLAWSPDGSVAVEAFGVDYAAIYFGSVGFAEAIPLRLVDRSMEPQRDLYPAPTLVRSMAFAPNGSWFVASFDLVPATPIPASDPAFDSIEIHFVVWETTAWSIVSDQVLTTYGALRNGSYPARPTSFAISPDGDRIAMWNADRWLPDTDLWVFPFPSFASTTNGTFPVRILSVAWNPQGDRLVVAAGEDRSATGYVLFLDPNDLSTVRTIPQPNTVFRDPSWSPDGQQVAVRATRYAYMTSPCSSGWKVVNVSIRVYQVPSNASPRILWGTDSADPCGMRDDLDFLGLNGSATARFHPSTSYIALANGSSVSVLNSTAWEPVYSATLNWSAEFGYTDLHWAGTDGTFSYATLGMTTNSSGGGWPLDRNGERGLFVAVPRVPGGAVSLSGGPGAVHLFPGEPAINLTLAIELDSALRSYSSVEQRWSSPSGSWSLRYDVANRTLTQRDGSSLVILTSADPVLPFDPQVPTFFVSLMPLWDVGYEGAWSALATATLWNGSSTPLVVNAALSSHVEVQLVGPLVVSDAVRGRLSADDWVNGTPTLIAAWMGAEFVFANHSLVLDGFSLTLWVGPSPAASTSVVPPASGTLSATPSLSTGTVTVRLTLSHASGHAADRTTASVMLRVDTSPPTIVFDAPANDSWWRGPDVEARFRVGEPNSGRNESSIHAFFRWADGSGEGTHVQATAAGGAAGDAERAFSATVILPPNAAGTVTVSVVAVDRVGNQALAYFALRLDRVLPEVDALAWPAWVNTSTLVISWTCTDLHSGTSLVTAAHYLDPLGAEHITTGDLQGSPPATDPTRFTATLEASEGESGTLWVECSDRVGNMNVSAPLPLRVDLTPPYVAGWTPSDATVLVGSTHTFVTWLVEDASGIPGGGVRCVLSTDGGATFGAGTPAALKPLQNGTVEAGCAVTLAEGTANRILVTATDAAGNSASYGPFWLRVNVPPTASILRPADGSGHASGFLTLEVDAADADDDIENISWVDTQTGATLGYGRTISTGFGRGNHSVEVRVTDSADHVTVARVSFSVEGPSSTNEGWPLWVLLVPALAIIAILVGLRLSRARGPEDEE